MPITIYPGSMKKRNANGSYSDLVPAIATDPEVLDDFAEEYSTSETYNIGDYCIHNSDLYKCNTNNTTGTWNSNAWDRVTVGDELVDHKNTLTQLGSDVSDLETTTGQLDQNIAYVESGDTASRYYSGGEFISWKGTLYTANGVITSGATFASGGNLSPVLTGGLNSVIKVSEVIQLDASGKGTTQNAYINARCIIGMFSNQNWCMFPDVKWIINNNKTFTADLGSDFQNGTCVFYYI